ncbi:MAG: CDP-diacylglycerol--glycerol-3-phosphate 3-phosphatidyltransferase [Clostridia bacterium]
MSVLFPCSWLSYDEPIASPWNRYIAFLIFAFASYTDHLDGHLARSRGLVTNFGKFMDPGRQIAGRFRLDMFCRDREMAAWIVIILVAREFIISGFRLVAAAQGVVIAAGIWGKAKTVVQMVMTLAVILGLPYGWYGVIVAILTYASVALTIISVVDYIWKNRSVLKEAD